MSFNDELNKLYSYIGHADWKSVVFALIGLFVVSRVLKYYNAKRVSAILTDVQLMVPPTELELPSGHHCCLRAPGYPWRSPAHFKVLQSRLGFSVEQAV
jgi:hypothetical protein